MDGAIQLIKESLDLKKNAIYLIFLSIITAFFGLYGGLPLGLQDSVLGPALNAARSFGNPHYFSSPAFIIYIFMFIYILLFSGLYLIGRIHSPGEFKVLFETNTLIDSPIHVPFQLPGHLIIVFFSVIGVICTYLIAYKLIKNRIISFISALFVSLSFLWISNSHNLSINIPFVAIIAITILLILIFLKEDGPMSLKQVIILGILLGIASSTKYNGFLVSIAIFVSMLVSYRKKYLQLLKHILIIGIVAAIILVILNPYIFLDYKTFHIYTSIQREQNFGGGWYGIESDTAHSWKAHITNSLYSGYGLFPLILSTIGILSLIFNRKINLPSKLVITIFPMFFYFIMGLQNAVLLRHMLPIFPFLGLYSGLGVYFLYSGGMKLIHNKTSAHTSIFKIFLILALVLVVSASLYPSVRNSVKQLGLLKEVDTRTGLLNVLNDAGLNGSNLNVYYGRYLSDAIYNNSNFTIGINLWAQSINEDVLKSEADVIVFDSFSHDRVVYSNRSGNQNRTYENHYGLSNDIKKDYKNFEGLYVIQITPFTIPKEQVPFTPLSIEIPFIPDLEFRKKPGPFIEMYFKNKTIAGKVEGSCKRQNVDCIILTGKDSYYFRHIESRVRSLNPYDKSFNPF